MQRSLFLAICIAAGVAACTSDPVSTPTFPAVITPTTPPLRSLVGTVDLLQGGVFLTQAEVSIRLIGSEADALRSLAGAEVEVRGTNIAAEAFLVSSFSVRMVDGQPATDGILEEVPEGYGLWMPDNTLKMIVDPPAELIQYVGERVWIAGPADQPPVAFGVISHAEAQKPERRK